MLKPTLKALYGQAASTEAYGHAAILRSYCRMNDKAPLIGTLQHGWNGALELALEESSLNPSGNWPFRQFVWSQASVDFARRHGVRGVTSIGAPWLYLFEGATSASMTSQTRPDLEALFIVSHSVNDHNIANASKAIEDLISATAGPVAVLLHWHEMKNSVWPRVCQSYGVEVLCSLPQFDSVGRRIRVSYGSDYLTSIRDLLLRTSSVFVDWIGTAALYAAFLGLRVNRLETDYRPRNSYPSQKYEQYLLKEFSQWNNDDQFRFAMEQLGIESVRGPSELREVLGWSHRGQAWSRRSEAIATMLSRRLRRLSSRVRDWQGKGNSKATYPTPQTIADDLMLQRGYENRQP